MAPLHEALPRQPSWSRALAARRRVAAFHALPSLSLRATQLYRLPSPRRRGAVGAVPRALRFCEDHELVCDEQ